MDSFWLMRGVVANPDAMELRAPAAREAAEKISILSFLTK
jgi:hypothetical protein